MFWLLENGMRYEDVFLLREVNFVLIIAECMCVYKRDTESFRKFIKKEC